MCLTQRELLYLRMKRSVAALVPTKIERPSYIYTERPNTPLGRIDLPPKISRG